MQICSKKILNCRKSVNLSIILTCEFRFKKSYIKGTIYIFDIWNLNFFYVLEICNSVDVGNPK